MAQNRKKVLALGAGYAGLQAVTRLQKEISANEAGITLVNKNKCHYEATWLHEASASTLSYEDLIYPIESIIGKNKVNFINAEVAKIDRNAGKVGTTHGIFEYDILVVALGFESETLGTSGMKEHAFQIKNIHIVRELSRHIEDKSASYAVSKEKDENDLAILIGGAGFTGIEFLGELTDRISELCSKHGVDQNRVRITCAEAMPRILPMFSENFVNYVVNYLEEYGVELKIGTPIVTHNEKGFKAEANDREQQLEANTAVWAAGVRGSQLMEESFEGAKRGHIVTKQDLVIDGHDDISVIDDVSTLIPAGGERPLLTIAQTAMQQGVHVVKNTENILNGQATTDFEYIDRGIVCSLGSRNGVGHVFGRDIIGEKAAFMKKVIDAHAVFKMGGVGLAFKKDKF